MDKARLTELKELQNDLDKANKDASSWLSHVLARCDDLIDELINTYTAIATDTASEDVDRAIKTINYCKNNYKLKEEKFRRWKSDQLEADYCVQAMADCDLAIRALQAMKGES